MNLQIYCDGASRGNPGPSAAAFVVFDDAGNEIKRFKHFLGVTTNNQAEYAAVLMAHRWLACSKTKDLNITKADFILDSQLVVNQLSGVYKIKNPNIANLVIQIRILQKKIKYPISFTHVKRGQNFLADGLANEALDEKMKK